MNKDEAIKYLIEKAKDRFAVIDGEWGCCHSFEDVMAGRYGTCSAHEEAAELAAVIAVLS